MLEKLKVILSRLGWGVFLAAACVYVLVCAYALPRSEKLHITGTEVVTGAEAKRYDVTSPDGSFSSTGTRLIVAEEPAGSTRVFANVDTGWGWPPYFKFDSGTLSGEAISLAKSRSDAFVLVTYYGWRIEMLSWYPNVVSLKVVDKTYDHVPYFNIIFGFLNLFGVAYVYFKLRGWKKRRAARKAAAAAAAPTV